MFTSNPAIRSNGNRSAKFANSHQKAIMSQSYETKFLTTKEVAALLKVNEKMVYSLVNEKGLPATKITGKMDVSPPLG